MPLRAQAQARRKALTTAYNNGTIGLDSVRVAFTEVLLNGIFPYWYGTDWSFEGHTAQPRQGQIACGYFVSTTLLDAGMALNRYQLAQKSPVDEARVLCMGDSVIALQKNVTETITQVLERQIRRDGLYFIGLGSNHVGYLYKKEGQMLAIHSNYSGPDSYVTAQYVHLSVYAGFDQFYIVPITWNDSLLLHWLKGQKVAMD